MTLHRGLHVFSLKRYCVTVMDNWTPLRLFWTRDGALKWRDSVGGHAHAYRWHSNIRKWIEMSRAHMGNGALPNGPSYRGHPRLYGAQAMNQAQRIREEIMALERELAELRAEVARLHEIETLYKAGCEQWRPVYKVVLDERDALRAEVARLTSGNDKLRAYAETVVAKLSAALEPKP